MTYVIGVTGGLFIQGAEDAQQYAGLYWKANYSLTKGVNFIQLDLQSIAEFQEPNLKEQMEKVFSLGIETGLHSETTAFGSEQFPHLDSAINVDYTRGHERLVHIIDEAGKLKMKYILFHSSESYPFIFLNRTFQPVDLVDIWGRPLGIFIEDRGNTGKKFLDEKGKVIYEENWIKDWLWKPEQKYILMQILRRGDPHEQLEEVLEKTQQQKQLESQRKLEEEKPKEQTDKEKKTEKEKESSGELSKEEEERIRLKFKDLVFKQFYDNLRSKDLSYGSEQVAYYIIAYWMQQKSDPLWKNIIDVTVKYYATKEKKTVEEWKKDRGIKEFSLDDPVFRNAFNLWVPAVSAKYVWGHFMPEECPTSEDKKEDPKKYLKKHKLFFVLETPMAGPGYEDLLRFPQPAQMYYLIKELEKGNGEGLFAIAIDVEHMLMDGLNLDAAFEVLPSNGGKMIKVVHTGWPSPVGPAHIPIPIGSEQQRFLYETYYKLQQKGMGKESTCYLIFERGGGGDPIKQSVIALRMIKEQLEKNIEPDKLPMDFYGISSAGFLSEERQLAMIKEHYWDPLKGTLVQPEEDYTFLGKAALEKGKRPEEWKKEELR